MKVGVAGAGSIGCFVGGMLAAGGHAVAFLGRGPICAQIGSAGLRLSDSAGGAWDAAGMACGTDAAILAGCEVVLVCVKSRDTGAIATQIAPHLAAGCIVVSLQNGVRNAEILRAALGGVEVRAGMAPFNVVALGEGRFHRATSGIVALEGAATGLAARLRVEGLAFEEHADFAPIQWGKLLVNLNNALNALSGLPLKQQLMQRGWRRLLAAQMDETLAVLRAAGIRPARFTAAPVRLTPHVLRLPTGIFRRLAARMLTIDDHARSSMQDDLRAGRPTEIDALQGEVLDLARRHALPCPTIEAVAAAIRRAEAAGNGPPMLKPSDIRHA